jgi:hypothetical protein
MNTMFIFVDNITLNTQNEISGAREAAFKKENYQDITLVPPFQSGKTQHESCSGDSKGS